MNTQTYHGHGRKKKVMNMSKFVRRVSELLDDYEQSSDVDSLEDIVDMIELEISLREAEKQTNGKLDN